MGTILAALTQRAVIINELNTLIERIGGVKQYAINALVDAGVPDPSRWFGNTIEHTTIVERMDDSEVQSKIGLRYACGMWQFIAPDRTGYSTSWVSLDSVVQYCPNGALSALAEVIRKSRMHRRSYWLDRAAQELVGCDWVIQEQDAPAA